MPSRTSRSRAAAPAQAHSSPSHTPTLATHGSQITILWVLMLFLSLGGALVLLTFSMRLRALEYGVVTTSQGLAQLNTRMQQLNAGKATSALPTPAATTASTILIPPLPAVGSMMKSPSGALNRGSLSPDGTKYAGYNDTVKGKIGLAVEIVATQKVRYIEILNPTTESTGAGTPMETGLSVRWIDNQTISYDVLVMKGGQQIKETRTTKIYF